MRITTYGTGGSIPISGPQRHRHGGNTTCLRVESPCLPKGTALVIDAGSGLIPLVHKALREEVEQVYLFFTHYHHDHTQGLLLAPWTYMKNVRLHLYGPTESGQGPRQMLEHVMQPPYHPVSFAQVSSHMTFKKIEHPASMIILIHPAGGVKMFSMDEFERAVASSQPDPQVLFNDKLRYPVNDCLVIRLYRSNHPERTISYRFEEKPTGKTFVFLTDNENQDGTPKDLLQHLWGADLLIMDSQYSRKQYENGKAGFGHGTPDFCVGVAHEAKVWKLGLTHHDPASTDEAIDALLAEADNEARQIGYTGNIEACKDYGEFVLS